jgi:prolyl oligopeptidase
MQYPQTRRDAVQDNYHGTTVADPYRWLEDDNSAETKAWVEAQNKVTNAFLAKIPYRQQIADRLTTIWNFERFGVPFREGSKYYYFRNDGLQNQSVLFVQDDLDAKGRVMLDPNKFSTDGTVALGAMSFDKSGRYMAYQISEAGSDWNRILVLDTETGKMLNDTIRWVKFSGIAWQGNGFYYSRYPEPAAGDALKGKSLNHAVYYHELGTHQGKDQMVKNDLANPNFNFGIGVSEDENFNYCYVSESTSGEQLYFRSNKRKSSDWVHVVTDFTYDYSVIDNDGDRTFVMTNNNAPRQKIMVFDANNPTLDKWTELVAEHETDVLTGAVLIGNRLLLTYMHDAYSVVRIHDARTGAYQSDLKLPGIGSVGGFSYKNGDKQAFYSFTSFTYPTTIFKLDIGSMTSSVYRKPDVKGFDPALYETRQVWFNSKDGTRVPMFVTHKKGITLDGNNTTLLYGYGGFNISLTPSFSVARLAFLEQGGVFVVANIRGGGEFGSAWHKAGTKERKQNVFDDFIGAAETLIKLNYTKPEKLAIEGGSNGGLLVGACMTQRPDLFRVCFPRVGVLDMLRYHQFTIGRAWSVDYGLSDDPEGFKYLYRYSPLHNVKPAAYPATLVMTADHDDRVVPAHSFKFAAELQSKHTGPLPTLIRIESSAGHGAGKPTAKVIEETADMLAFLFYNMGVNYK